MNEALLLALATPRATIQTGQSQTDKDDAARLRDCRQVVPCQSFPPAILRQPLLLDYEIQRIDSRDKSGRNAESGKGRELDDIG